MNQDDQALNPSEDAQAVDELTFLKERAKVMGIPFSNNISLETLRKRIADLEKQVYELNKKLHALRADM